MTVLLNPASGTSDSGERSRRITKWFSTNGLNARVSLIPEGSDVTELARAAIGDGDRIIVAGGGDGTISAVASALVGTDSALGVLPVGTLNHFAKDLQIPLDLEAAVRVISQQKIVQVDVGEVNGRIFLNNSSLGLYPHMVLDREKQQRTGRGKWAAMFWAGLAVLRRSPFLNLRLNVNGEELLRTTPFVFVGNNEYEIEGIKMGTRQCLDGGHLSLHVAQPSSRRHILWLSLSALLGRIREAEEFEVMCTKEAWIESRHKRLRVSFDGEVSVMETPLHYRVRPRALRVVAP